MKTEHSWGDYVISPTDLCLRHPPLIADCSGVDLKLNFRAQSTCAEVLYRLTRMSEHE